MNHLGHFPLDLNEFTPFPRSIEIQTTNLCNARCNVCPYSTTTAYEPKANMAQGLFESLIAQCAEHRSELERLIPYFNNEPFADRRILDRLRSIREKVGVHVELSTNASLLGEERARILLEERLVHTLRVSIFGEGQRTYEHRMKQLKWARVRSNVEVLLKLRDELKIDNSIAIEIVVVPDRDLTAAEVERIRRRWEPQGAMVRVFGYLDRAGNCAVRNLLPLHQRWGVLRGCELNRPVERMVIRTDGACVLCSQDWRATTVLGDASRQSLTTIWNGPEYQRVRAELRGERTAAPNHLCRNCKLAIIE